jgi:hypothetical protein
MRAVCGECVKCVLFVVGAKKTQTLARSENTPSRLSSVTLMVKPMLPTKITLESTAVMAAVSIKERTVEATSSGSALLP